MLLFCLWSRTMRQHLLVHVIQKGTACLVCLHKTEPAQLNHVCAHAQHQQLGAHRGAYAARERRIQRSSSGPGSGCPARAHMRTSANAVVPSNPERVQVSPNKMKSEQVRKRRKYPFIERRRNRKDAHKRENPVNKGTSSPCRKGP